MIEIPRYVHRGGQDMLVDTLDGLRLAEAEGWRVNPNEPDVLFSAPVESEYERARSEVVLGGTISTDGVWTPTGQAERVSTVAVEAALAEEAEASGEALDAPEEASEDVPAEEPAVPAKRGPGRPRRNG